MKGEDLQAPASLPLASARAPADALRLGMKLGSCAAAGAADEPAAAAVKRTSRVARALRA